MPKKSYQKKKRYREMCRRMVVEGGKINQANGVWLPATSKTTDTHMQAGYKAGRH